MPSTPVRFLPILLLLAAGAAVAGCRSARVDPVPPPPQVERPAAFDHADFSAVLAQVVDGRGLVDYDTLKTARLLDPYLRRLAATDPAALPEADRIAFWINAYNATTLKLVADNYPVASILRITPIAVRGLPLTIPGTSNSPFKLKVARVGGQLMTLDHIEHGILRKAYREPRIHAALVCAAVSCPPLRREAYTGAALDAQLSEQMRGWLADASKNRLSEREAALSPIFSWFKEDFGGTDAAVVRFVAPYVDPALRPAYEAARPAVRYLGYDWSLNGR